jgi:hypothetical protein
MKQILDTIAGEVGMAQSIVDTWMEEWLQQGIQQGVQQGARLKEGQIIRQLLNRGTFSPEEIASLVNVDIARVREIAEDNGKEVKEV